MRPGSPTDADRMLVVDDDAPVREVLSEYFVALGYVVDTAADGREALDALVRERPDVVLLDMRMPEMDGMDVLRRLRRVDPDVPVIMVTANDDVALARQTLAIGAFGYVAKPFDFEHLTRTVTTALLHSARALRPDATVPPAGPSERWTRFLADVFGTVRGMTPEGRATIGARLEDAALAAARRAMAGCPADAEPSLIEIKLLAGVARELGDLSAPGCSVIEAALRIARAELPPR